MTRKKTIVASLVCLGIALFGIFLAKGYPVTFITSKIAGTGPQHDSAVFNPLQGYNVDEGDWEVYLIIDKYDFEKLTPALTHYRVWRVDSPAALKNIQATWNFKPTGSDMATVTSSLIVVHDQQIVFKAGIVLDENAVGLQSEHVGWAEATHQEHFAESLKSFTKVWSPFVFI